VVATAPALGLDRAALTGQQYRRVREVVAKRRTGGLSVVDVTMCPMSRARLGSVLIDTDDPAGLAAFYSELLSWPIGDADDESVSLTGPDGVDVDFQLVINHRPPSWPGPEVPQQMHLDFYVDDLAAAVSRAEELGARRAGVSPGKYFVTLVDPSGHPFCLCLEFDRRNPALPS
jgi:predicted enzyme related to lactoylglutathione lyase